LRAAQLSKSELKKYVDEMKKDAPKKAIRFFPIKEKSS